MIQLLTVSQWARFRYNNEGDADKFPLLRRLGRGRALGTEKAPFPATVWKRRCRLLRVSGTSEKEGERRRPLYSRAPRMSGTGPEERCRGLNSQKAPRTQTRFPQGVHRGAYGTAAQHPKRLKSRHFRGAEEDPHWRRKDPR